VRRAADPQLSSHTIAAAGHDIEPQLTVMANKTRAKDVEKDVDF